jgi:hypothetical protein
MNQLARNDSFRKKKKKQQQQQLAVTIGHAETSSRLYILTEIKLLIREMHVEEHFTSV